MELEVERHVLTSTIRLSDGTHELVFSRKPKRGPGNNILYNCNICAVSDLSGERCLHTHIAGRRHQLKLTPGKIDAELYRAKMAGSKRSAGT